jgi:hypoxanthine phosphoribosyltransferase
MDDWKPLFTQQEIQTRTQQLAEKITGDYKGKDFIAICVLKGAFLFFADLIRLIDLPVTVDFIIASSYIKNQSSGRIQIDYQMKEVVEDKDVLIGTDWKCCLLLGGHQ